MIFHVSLDDFRPSLVFVLRLDIMHCHPPTAQCALDVACTGRAVVPSMEGLPNMVITRNKFPDFCKVKFGAPEEVPKIPKSIPKSSSNLLFLKAMVRLQESLGKWIWTYYVHNLEFYSVYYPNEKLTTCQKKRTILLTARPWFMPQLG